MLRTLSLAVAPLLLCSGSALAQGSPNILILVADDMGVEQYAAYGEGFDLPNTPVLDALAQEGVLFRNAWAYPLCTPARASIQTGRYGFRTGLGDLLHFQGQALPPDEFILPEMLDAGTNGAYAHAAFGKWHLANDSVGGDSGPNLAGWDHFDGLGVTSFFTYTDWEKVTNGVGVHTTDYVTTDQVDSALEWIGTQTDPWLVHMGFVAPHNPLHAPPAKLHTVNLQGAGNPVANPRPYYKAMVESMDTEIGRLLDGLGDARDNTVVIFLADNGTQTQAAVFPHPSDQAKGTVYEGGVNVPLVISGPPVTNPGSESAALVSTVDIFSTVAELAGVDLGSTMPAGVELDSLSLVPYLTDPDTPSERDIVYSERFNPNGPGEPPTYRRTVRTATHKLITRNSSPDELYNLELDPYEDVDLLLEPLAPENAAIYAELLAAIDELILPWPASVFPYGCINPAGSLTALNLTPHLGENLVLEIDNPFPTQLPGSLSVLQFALKPDSAFPCGNPVMGYGMSGHGPGEVLIATQNSTMLPGPPWGGSGIPAQISLPVPASSALLLENAVYFQAAILGLPGSNVSVGVTNALKVQFAL